MSDFGKSRLSIAIAIDALNEIQDINPSGYTFAEVDELQKALHDVSRLERVLMSALADRRIRLSLYAVDAQVERAGWAIGGERSYSCHILTRRDDGVIRSLCGQAYGKLKLSQGSQYTSLRGLCCRRCIQLAAKRDIQIDWDSPQFGQEATS